MNRRFHRVVFNAARQARVVVQETAKSAGKASGATTAVLATTLALLGTPASGQIAADPFAPGSQRPTILAAPNGVPLVNITTPSAAGVSINQYHQFDVNANGAILNNAVSTAQTQLGGYVQGNPWLAAGGARIIVNQVNSSNPSYLHGYVEVAGQRAEVIIANPSGIQVNGGGFINASRATLTTGTPQFNALGGLDSFLVRGGTITVDGAGLDLSRTDYAAILARAVTLNAGIWATDLKVVTGANQVSADHSQITPVAGTGAAPVFALDVAALGGMYAGKIVLVGSEQGVGVRNAGNIGASAGSLVVTAAGRLENTGTLQASADATLAAQAIANSGTVASRATLKVTTQGDLTNNLHGAGGTLEGQRVELSSAAGDIDNRSGGTIRQTSYAGLTLAAPALSNTNGGVIGAEPAPAAPTSAGSTGTASGAGTAPATGASFGGGTSMAGSTTAATAPVAPGTLTAAGTIRNDDGGHIYASGPIALQTPQINNAGGSLSVANMAVGGPSFSNAGGTLNVGGSFSANVGSFDNTGGALHAGSLSIATTGDLNNTDGQLTSDTDASLSIGGNLTNTRGMVSAAGALSANVAGAVGNSAGSLIANQGLNLSAASLDNASKGSLRAGNDATVAVSGALANDGSITAGRHTTIAADSVQSGSAGVLGAGIRNDGSLGSTGDLKVTATHGLAANGTHRAAGNATLQGASVDLSGSQTSAANIAITATQGNVTTRHASVVTPGTLAVNANAQAGQSLVNDAGTLNAGQLSLNVSNLANTNGGQLVQTGTGATTIAVTGALNNAGGRIASNGQDLSLQAGGRITNAGGRIEHAGTGTLGIAGTSFDGANGSITGNGAVVANIAGAFSQDGGSTSARQITIDAGALNNRGGQIVQTGTGATRITVAGALDNSQAGTIASNGATTIAASSLNNQGATIRAAGSADLILATAGLLDNTAAGQIGAGGNVIVGAGSLKNDAGGITAVGNLGATVSGAASNIAGTLAANGNTTLSAASLDSTGGQIAAVTGNLQVTTTGATINTAGRMQAAGNVMLVNAGLVNDQGKVSGNAVSVDTNGAALSNALGTLAAAATLDVHSGALANDAGLIQSGGAMTIHANGQALSNTHAAGYSNGQGGIVSADTLTIHSGDVNNSAGFVGSKNALNATTGSVSNVNGGVILGQSAVAMDTQGGTYDNRGGQTLAAGDLTLNAGAVQNSAGLLRSGATTAVNATAVDNTATRGTDQGIEGRNVAIATASLNNTSGAVRSDANTTITSGGSVDNTSGLISAGDTLRIADPNVAKTLSVTNTNGTLVANNSVQIDAAGLSWDGQLLSQRDLSVALTQDIVTAAGSQTIANHDLTLSTTGNISNAGKIAAGHALTLNAANIDNATSGEISAGLTTLNAASTLTNRGLIDGVDTRINAGTVNNVGTGRIYGDHVAIQAGTLNNDAESLNGLTSAATIGARQLLDIGAESINNANGALIFSAGDMAIGGGLDADGHAVGTAGMLTNRAATIEAAGNLSANVATLNNLNGGVTWTMQPGQTTSVHEYALPGDPTRYPDSQVLLMHFRSLQESGQIGEAWGSFTSELASMVVVGSGYNGIAIPALTQYPLVRYAVYYQNSPRHSTDMPAEICSGGEGASCATVSATGAWYAATDPIWATFGITPPPVLAADNPGLLYPSIAPGMTGYVVVVNGETVTNNFAHPVTQAEYDQYTAYMAAHRALDVATSAFIQTFSRIFTNWYEWNYTATGNTPVLQTSAPARILSGGAMNLNVASGTNDTSQIIAGGTLTVAGGTITNRNARADAQLVESGIQSQVLFQDNGFHISYAPFNLTVDTTVMLAAARQEGNVPVGETGTTISTLQSTQTGQAAGGAGGAGGVGGGSRVAPIIEVPAAIGGMVKTPGGSAGANTGVALDSSAGSGTTVPMVVRTTMPSLGVPTASLFRTHPESTSHFLVETDPRFANYRNWLSSGYMINALGLDPNNVIKRLGDGFYEQRLIREQVAQLTGQRYLGGYNDDQTEYTALMNAGVAFAQQYHLTLGVALTDAQMAQLTSDIVWLVQQTVSIPCPSGSVPDACTQQVLVPQVYVRVRPGDIDGSGALLAGREVNIKLTGNLNNSGGTVAGRSVVAINADNVNNLGGRISGQDVGIKAATDLNAIGGTIGAQNSLVAQAGRNINIESTRRTSTGATAPSGLSTSLNTMSATVVDQVAGLYVSNPGGVLVASAGHDLNLIGAIVSNGGQGGQTLLAANNDINLGTVSTGKSNSTTWSLGNFRVDESTQQVGTSIQTAGDLTLAAGHDITARTATVNSTDGEVTAMAGHDISIVAGQSIASVDQMTHLVTGGQFSSETTITTDHTVRADAAPSSVGGKTVNLVAGNDIVIQGSNVVSDTGTTLAAGHDIAIVSSQDTRSSESWRQHSQSGVYSSDAGITLGQQEETNRRTNSTSTSVGSTVGAIAGDVIIVGGYQYSQIGSDVRAPGGDINILARDVSVTEARNTSHSQEEQSTHQSGITLGAKSSVMNAVQGALSTTESMSASGDGRMQALGAASIGMSAYSTASKFVPATASGPNSMGGASAGIGVTIGASSSHSESESKSNTAAGSNVVAGRDVNIIATGAGAGAGSGILIQGGNVAAGHDVNLVADNAITLQAASNHQSQQSSGSSSNASIAVNYSGGTQNGWTVDIAAGTSKGSSSSSDTSWTNTHVTAGNAVNLQSGGDTTIRGATVEGSSVTANVGGNLSIESLQDSGDSTAKQSDAGFSASLCIPPACYGASSASVNVGSAHGTGNYATVQEQSGIKADDGGFDVHVAGNTTLIGAVIESTQVAIDDGQNSFSTASLSTTDLLNTNIQQATGFSVGGGMSGTGSGLSPSGSAGIGNSTITQSTLTRSGISGIAGETTVRTGVDTANALQHSSSATQQAVQQAQAAAQITAQFGSQAASAWGQYASRREADATTDEERACWAEGGPCRVAGHGVIGGLAGGVEGAVGATASQAIIDQIGRLIAQTDLPLNVKQALIAVAGATVGAAAGGSPGAASAFNATVNNYLTVVDLKKKVAQELTTQQASTQGTENSLKLADACIESPRETCGKAIAKAADDVSNLRDYRVELQAKQADAVDASAKANFGQQIKEVDKQIASTSNAIRVAMMALNGGSFNPSTMTDQEFFAMGAAFDATGAAELRAIGKSSNAIATWIENAKFDAQRLAEINQKRIENNIYTSDGGSSALVGVQTSAGIIPVNPAKTTTILGRSQSDMQSVIDVQLKASKSDDVGPKPGGINVLNVSAATEAAAGPHFFENVNKPFLDVAINRGDDFALATMPVNKADYIDVITGSLKGSYSQELQYLVQKDVKPVNISNSKWNEIKGWYQ